MAHPPPKYLEDMCQVDDDMFGKPIVKEDERYYMMEPLYNEGIEYLNTDQIPQARETFTKAAHVLTDEAFPFPTVDTIGFKRDFYMKMPLINKAFLMNICLLVIECCHKENKHSLAISWGQELDIILAHSFLIFPLVVTRDWYRHEMMWKKYSEHVHKIKSLIDTALVMEALKNTAACHHSLTLFDMYLPGLSEEDYPKYLPVASDDSPRYLLHPSRDWKPPYCEPALHIRGAWRKLPVKSSGVMGRRHSCSGFVWRKHLYVIGGSRHDDTSTDTRNVWRLDLENPTGWEYVCQYPTSVQEYARFCNRDISVYKDRAYLFTGRPQLDVFDLVTRTWITLTTAWEATECDADAFVRVNWPWHKNTCEGACQQIIQGRLFVFGGLNGDTWAGSNLFMELDLTTLRWRRLSGYPCIWKHHDVDMPGPRWGASSWINKDQDRFYLMYGQCNKRTEARLVDECAPEEPWMYDDIWSWDIRQETWRRERVLGNVPSARTGFGCVYNEKFDKLIVFGGENPTLSKNLLKINEDDPSSLPDRVCYLADTFIYQPLRKDVAQSALELKPNGSRKPLNGDDLKWKQVLTYGFPTWRSNMLLVCDQDKGSIYMYGGMARSDVIPTHSKSKTRAFGDLWELQLDIPGGDFQTVNLEDEERTAAVGSRKRCFNCLEVGYWKKCGGTCRGRAFFCKPECLKLGWDRHKEMHHCRKE